VLKNYEILGDALGFEPGKLVLSHQTHTDIVLRVGEKQAGAGLFAPELPECDALITNEPGVGLVIFTADCTPILLQDSVTGAVGAVHAGWRGTAADIAGKTVAAMTREFGSDPADIRAAIGPNIAQC
jgi:YfiH family protein